MRCPFCNEELFDGASKCSKCGMEIPEVGGAPQEKANEQESNRETMPEETLPEENIYSSKRPERSSSKITEEDFRNFIGNNAEKYIEKFKNFEEGGADKFKATWHWPAFFFTFLWLLYRKFYVRALIFFVLSLIPLAGLILAISYGIRANYIYFRHAKEKITEIKKSYPAEPLMKAALADTGGVNKIAVAIPLGFMILGIFAAMAIPQFLQYRNMNSCTIARTNVEVAYSVAQAYYGKHQKADLTDIKQLEEFGFKPPKDIVLKVMSGAYDTMLISAGHSFCKKTFYVDASGNVSDSEPTVVTIPVPAAAPVAPPMPPPAGTTVTAPAP